MAGALVRSIPAPGVEAMCGLGTVDCHWVSGGEGGVIVGSIQSVMYLPRVGVECRGEPASTCRREG